MWVPKLLISPVIIRIFCPKTTKFGPNLAFLSIAGSFGALLVGWLVVVARAVSRKTPIYFIYFTFACRMFFNFQLFSPHLFHFCFRGEKLKYLRTEHFNVFWLLLKFDDRNFPTKERKKQPEKFRWLLSSARHKDCWRCLDPELLNW